MHKSLQVVSLTSWRHNIAQQREESECAGNLVAGVPPLPDSPQQINSAQQGLPVLELEVGASNGKYS